jgi:diguanylate cyclase (GGDEF)-like protein
VQATLERELSCAADAGRPTCLLRLDLDGFKHVNDLLGPEAGDALLHDLARVLRDAVRPTDVLGRLGGDEFAVLLPATELEVAIAVGGRLVDAVRLHGHVVGRRARAELTASCGVVAAAPDARTPAGELLQQAELALYDAKKAGRDRVATYDADAGVAARDARHDHWLGRLRRALAEDRLILHAQPLVPLDGVQDGPVRREVLLRLVGEEGELVPPAEFLAHAERHGLVVDLDLWVLRRTVARLRAAAAAGRPERLSVNLSARSVEDPRMAAELERLLAAVPLPAGALTIEITETAAIHDVVAAGALTRRLHELGARVALDDFGAGHACLAALKHFALDELKVDGSLVAGLASSPTDQLVVRAVVGIAAELGLDVVAEHVGDAATAALLREMGVDLGQGFLLGRPLPLGA